MTTAPKALYADTHPHDLIYRAQCKLELFNILLATSEEGGGVNFDSQVVSNGIFYLLDGIAREMELALGKLQEVAA